MPKYRHPQFEILGLRSVGRMRPELLYWAVCSRFTGIVYGGMSMWAVNFSQLCLQLRVACGNWHRRRQRTTARRDSSRPASGAYSVEVKPPEGGESN